MKNFNKNSWKDGHFYIASLGGGDLQLKILRPKSRKIFVIFDNNTQFMRTKLDYKHVFFLSLPKKKLVRQNCTTCVVLYEKMTYFIKIHFFGIYLTWKSEKYVSMSFFFLLLRYNLCKKTSKNISYRDSLYSKKKRNEIFFWSVKKRSCY